MLIRYEETSCIDVDAIVSIRGNYQSDQPEYWRTEVLISGSQLTVRGPAGKSIYDAYMQKHRHALYDMRPNSLNYGKQGGK